MGIFRHPPPSQQVMAAVISLTAAILVASPPASDAPPPFRGVDQARNYKAWTPRLWDAIQPPPPGSGSSGAPPQVDNPPPRSAQPRSIQVSWEPELFIQLPDQGGATLPIQGDEPPRIGHLRRRVYETIIRSWEEPFTYRRLLTVSALDTQTETLSGGTITRAIALSVGAISVRASSQSATVSITPEHNATLPLG